jgi:uncharacterized cupredoxin-like copper-binding protein
MDLVSGTRAGSGVRRLAAATVAVGLVVTVAGCGSSAKTKAGGSSSSKAPVTAAQPTKAAAIPHVNRVIVTETDSKLTLSVSSYKVASYTFSLQNSGKAKHALTINGPGLVKQTSATVGPGQTTDLIVPLVKGTYEVYSPLPGQRALGLATSITVR